MEGIKILIVEDEFIVANDIRNSLHAMGYVVTGIAASGEKAIRKAESEKPDLVLMDIMLRGEMNGIEAAKHIHSQFNLPVVFLTAYADPRIIEQAKAAKPFGYLIKSYEDRQLRVTIEIALDKFRVQEEIRHLALHDSLTDLPNRKLLYDRLTHARFRAYRYQQIVALLYIDLDEFGAVNKKFDQEAGDSILKEVASRLTESVRKTDTVARIGGDEFVVVIQDIRRKEDAKIVVEKIIQSVSEPIRFDDKTCVIHASIGISIYPYDGLDNDTLRKKADHVMHQVKRSGKNNYSFCDFPDECAVSPEKEDSEHLSSCDKLITKEMFYDRLTYIRSRAYQCRNFVGLLYVELDQRIDDTIGDGAGESVFEKVIGRLKRSIRETDTVVRIYESKFVIMLQGIQNKGDAEFVAKKVIQSVSAPISVNGKTYSISASIGISIYPYDGLDNQTLVEKADEAIRIKKSGKNNYYFCDFSAENCFGVGDSTKDW
ncbi:diguanylate cyclase [Desulfobacterales bacterium HSG2]|nr:diguanylate cyclase [Desulfobacterales bacterium HSG2]